MNFNIRDNGTADLVAFTAAPTSGEWLSGAGTATLALNGTIDYTHTYTIFQNAIATGYTGGFTFAAITGYDTADYTAVVAQVGNDYDLTFAAVPEPGTWGMLLGGLATLIAIQRRRRNV